MSQALIDFAVHKTKLCIEMEDFFIKIASIYHQPSIVFCDRGVCDGAAYQSSDHWN